jgi:hypothetical protein
MRSDQSSASNGQSRSGAEADAVKPIPLPNHPRQGHEPEGEGPAKRRRCREIRGKSSSDQVRNGYHDQERSKNFTISPAIPKPDQEHQGECAQKDPCPLPETYELRGGGRARLGQFMAARHQRAAGRQKELPNEDDIPDRPIDTKMS